MVNHRNSPSPSDGRDGVEELEVGRQTRFQGGRLNVRTPSGPILRFKPSRDTSHAHVAAVSRGGVSGVLERAGKLLGALTADQELVAIHEREPNAAIAAGVQYTLATDAAADAPAAAIP